MFFSIRKFYDAQPDVPSAASAMAKGGVLVLPGQPSPKATIDNNGPTDQPTEPTQTEPADTATSASSTEPQASTEPQTKSQDAPAGEPQAAPTQEKTWQEVLKNQQPNEVLKALGYGDGALDFLSGLKDIDPKMVNFFNQWKTKGNVKEYLQALSTDFKAMQPEDVMMHQLRDENPELSEEDLSILYDERVIQKYKLNSDSEDERRRGRILLTADAKPVRNSLITNQEKNLLPDAPPAAPPIDTLAEYQKKEAERLDAELKEVRSSIESDPLFRDAIQNKSFKFGVGDDGYNVNVPDAKKLISTLYEDAINKSIFTKDGKPIVERQLVLAKLFEDWDGFWKNYANHYKAIGSKATIDQVQNPSMPQAQTSQAEPAFESAAQAMAKEGRFVRGGQ